jgi:hypothetical protein
MYKILNEFYYLDLDRMEEYLAIPVKEGEDNTNQFSAIKYEMVKTLVEVIMSEHKEFDDNLGISKQELSIPFVIAFNTLLKHNILTKF